LDPLEKTFAADPRGANDRRTSMRCLLSVGRMPLGTGITGPRSLTSNGGSSHGGKSSPLVSPGGAS